MPILTGGAVVIEAQGTATEVTGTLTAFRDPQGWWAALITPAASLPAAEQLVGQTVRIKSSGELASGRVTDCIKLVAPVPTMQLLLRGEGDAPSA